MISLHWRSMGDRRKRLYNLYSKFLPDSDFSTTERCRITTILQAQIDRVRLIAVKVSTERELLIQKWNDVWHFTDNPFVMQNDDIKTSDEGTSAEIKSIMSEIDTADTQLNTSCSTKKPKTYHCSDPNATAEPIDRLFSSSITSFED